MFATSDLEIDTADGLEFTGKVPFSVRLFVEVVRAAPVEGDGFSDHFE